jgi:hypothetical protein
MKITGQEVLRNALGMPSDLAGMSDQGIRGSIASRLAVLWTVAIKAMRNMAADQHARLHLGLPTNLCDPCRPHGFTGRNL